MKREIKGISAEEWKNITRLAAEAELRGDVKLIPVGFAVSKEEKEEESVGFFETVSKTIKELSQLRRDTCLNLARDEDKALVKALLDSDKYEDQMLLGELTAKGLFDKWGKE